MKKIKNLFCFVIILSFLSGCAAKNFSEIFQDEIEIEPENVGYILVDKESNAILEAQNIDQIFIPASTVKIITAYSALEVMGADYKFKTKLKLDQNWEGKIQNKIYSGNIYLEGGFDPVLTVQDITNMVLQLKKAGIREIKGNFFYKTSAIDNLTEIDPSQPANAAYNSAIGTLNIARPDNAKNSVRVNDIFDLKTSLYQPIKKPTAFVADLFKRLAALHGIQINAPQAYNSKNTAANSELFFTHSSPTLVEITQLMLNQSINEIAEILAVKTAQNIAPAQEITSLAHAQQIIAKWLKYKFPSTNWENYYVQNGSGLASTSRITPNQFMAILKEAVSADFGEKSFITLLPISGWSGTLNSRLAESKTNLRVYAKTGTVNYGNSLVGGLFTSSNKELLFVILVSNVNQKNLLEQQKNILSKSDQEQSSSWTKRSRILQDQLIKKWVGETKNNGNLTANNL